MRKTDDDLIPPQREAPKPPGRSLRTQPRLSASLASLQDHSFDASWKRAKDKVIKILADRQYTDVSLPTNKEEFLAQNNRLPSKQINYNKFGKKLGKHRARHNLTVAHDFFPLFYDKLKSQIEPSLNNVNECLAILGIQGTATQAAQSRASEYRQAAQRYGEEATQSRRRAEEAEFQARMTEQSAQAARRETMDQRRAREREAQILVERQAEAAIAMNEENAALKERNKELERENNRLRKEMQMTRERSVELATQNAELMRENSEIREIASKKGTVGALSLEHGSRAAPRTTRGRSFGWRRKTQKSKEIGKGGGRKRTKKKCSKSQLKKKMLCVKGTKRRLKKLKKYTKRLKLKLTHCSKQRLAKNFSVRKKRKYTRRR